MSRAPYLLPGARWGERLGNGKVLDHMIHEGLTDAFHDIHMGITAENLVERYAITPRGPGRASRRRASARAAAIADGRFRAEIVPVPVPQQEGRDEAVRHRRAPAAGHDRRVPRQAEAGLQEGRHGHRGQRERAQRRRRRARRRVRRARAELGVRRERASCRTPPRRWIRR